MRRTTPGEARLHHLSCPDEAYVLTKWYVEEGDRVSVGQAVATIETASLSLEFQVFDAGVITRRYFSEGDAIPDGALVATIDASDAA